MDGIDLLDWDPIFLTQSSYSQVSEEKESDILSYFDLKPSDNDLEITRHQFRHGQPETAKSLQNKIEESVPKNSVKNIKWGGTEHRRLRLNSNPQITGPFQDKDAKLRYLLYKEDVSKANAGGLKHRKVVPKCVRVFENPENRNKCHRSNAVRVYKKTSADQQIEASNILYGLRPSDGSKKAKSSAAAGSPVGSASVECSTDESDKKTVTCNFSFNFSL
ncbi:unnamed protein product [Mytilus coruscus]|uniref:Uncharacterized protein n=1 Tax=Mytilus coruscus TaxID=42192 RepID=A0A6J8B535_MYTCO|nr:unnamed protein product [Mytilus coruscus]